MQSIKSIIATITILSSLISTDLTSYLNPTLYKAHATAYVLQGNTASGEPVREGICASGKTEYFNHRLALYKRKDDEVLEYIGTFDCLDNGCKASVIDVWCSDLDKAQEFMDLVYADGCQGKIWVVDLGIIDE